MIDIGGSYPDQNNDRLMATHFNGELNARKIFIVCADAAAQSICPFFFFCFVWKVDHVGGVREQLEQGCVRAAVTRRIGTNPIAKCPPANQTD